jgi:hypothetical protein
MRAAHTITAIRLNNFGFIRKCAEMTTAGIVFFEAEKLVREIAEGKKRQPIFVQPKFPPKSMGG